MATLYGGTYGSNTTTRQYSYIQNSYGASKFTNTTGSSIKILAVEVYCCGQGTSSLHGSVYGFASTSTAVSGLAANSSTTAISANTTPSTFTTSDPPAASSYSWVTFSFDSPLTVAAGATFYAGLRGPTSTYSATSANAKLFIYGYTVSASSSSCAYYALPSSTNLYSYPTMGGSAYRNMDIRIVYELNGVVYIDNGSSFDAYQVFIDNGSSWDQYIPYVDNGSDWDVCV